MSNSMQVERSDRANPNHRLLRARRLNLDSSQEIRCNLTCRLLLGQRPSPSVAEPPRRSCPLRHNLQAGMVPTTASSPGCPRERGTSIPLGAWGYLPPNAGPARVWFSTVGLAFCFRLCLEDPGDGDGTVLGRGATVNNPESSQSSGGEKEGKHSFPPEEPALPPRRRLGCEFRALLRPLLMLLVVAGFFLFVFRARDLLDSCLRYRRS